MIRALWCALALLPLASGPIVVPAQGTATSLDIASWNLEWFGDTRFGPTDEALQLQNVRDVITRADMDIWGVEEVVSASAWRSLLSQLPAYGGVLANDPVVTNGAAFYSKAEQKVGLIYKTALATVVSARLILTADDFDFARRPPLEVTLRVTLNGLTENVVVIVLHMKAFNDAASWQRRLNAASALKAYLDATYPSEKVLVVGDFNDDVDRSITPGKPSPYQNFVDDSQDYVFPTKALSDAGLASTVSHPDMVDHHLDTNEEKATYIANSAQVFRADRYIANYGVTTSDHYPVFTRYRFGRSELGR